MDIRKLFPTPHAITAFALTAAIMLPCAVEAVSIGEVVLKNGLGEPLLAQVDLVAGINERIEGSCLSLAAPDPLQEDVGSFLTEANLSLKSEGQRQYVEISSPKPLNDALARLRLQVKCPGTRSVSKTLAISPSAQTASQKQGRPAPVTPELLGEPIDESRIGKISAEETALLLEQQKLLVASLLAMQHQLKLLQDELGEIKLQLTQVGVNPSSATAPATAEAASAPPTTHLATAGTHENNPEPAITVKQPVMQQDNPYLQIGLFAALGLALATLALWPWLRYHTKIKSRIEINSQQNADPTLKPADDVAAAPKIWVSPAIKRPSQLKSAHAPAVVLPPKASTARNVAAPFHLPQKVIGEKAAEVDSMLEEAGLYAANGRMGKAVEILLEIIKRCPSKTDAWTLLLSIYSALGKVAEFESTAREFLKHHKASPSWSGIQVLGRTLDHDNPLYADHSSHISASPLLPDTLNLHHPIGDILMGMGVLSKREILKYLDDFDPKKHGRFGGYLVARKAITIAQLDQALLQQQGVHAEVKPGDLPSLQDIENFLVNFDPKLHGSVAKFMASHHAVTPEQLSQLLQQQSKQGVSAKKPQADDPPQFDKISTS